MSLEESLMNNFNSSINNNNITEQVNEGQNENDYIDNINNKGLTL